MRLVVIGLGSMGRRRIRLTQGIDSRAQVVGVDRSDERCRQAEGELGIRTYADVADAVRESGARAALVCTSPISHGPIVLQCLSLGLHVFTELNLLSDWYDEAMRLATRKRLKIFVSSTFLYRRELQYVARSVRCKKINYIYHSGQYLPDWHPWENYRNFFVANRKTNACREILAIELPWLIRAFGPIESVQVMADRNSRLDIDFPDNYMIAVRHANGNKGFFCQDIVSRKGIRRLEVYSERLHLFWDGTPQTLVAYDVKRRELAPVRVYADVERRKGYNANIIENMYRDELKAFFRHLSGKGKPAYTIEDDRQVLSLIDKIEGAACE